MKNFGENVVFRPRRTYAPAHEEEVLAILDRHEGEQIRVRGSLHAWSEAAATDGVLIDLRSFDHVQIGADASGEPWAEVGGGCVLERLLSELERHGLTLPTIGAVTRQTIAGAIATATHGSGESSLSHYVAAVRLAAYDGENGRARIYEVTGGEALLAARCGVGCMGVTLSVKLRIRRQYWVTETISNEQRLEDVLARRGEWPLQQFMLIPYAWRFIAFNRQVASEPPATARRLLSRAYSLYDQLTLELLSHQLLARVLLRSSASGKPSHIVELFYRHLAPRLVVGPRTTTTAARGLTLHSRRHASTRHVEMELFVREEDLDDTVRLLKAIVGWAADSRTEFPSDLWADIERAGLGDELAGLRGSYMHHYAFIFRRVLADETLISMTSGGARYAIGVFTYLREEERGSYYAFCRFLARACVRLLGARLHWGKYVPLSFDEIQRLYPGFSAFHAQCSLVDPHGTFANEYAREVLGLPSLKGRA